MLTLVTTVFVPAQFATGVWGMNFENVSPNVTEMLDVTLHTDAGANLAIRLPCLLACRHLSLPPDCNDLQTQGGRVMYFVCHAHDCTAVLGLRVFMLTMKLTLDTFLTPMDYMCITMGNILKAKRLLASARVAGLINVQSLCCERNIIVAAPLWGMHAMFCLTSHGMRAVTIVKFNVRTCAHRVA